MSFRGYYKGFYFLYLFSGDVNSDRVELEKLASDTTIFGLKLECQANKLESAALRVNLLQLRLKLLEVEFNSKIDLSELRSTINRSKRF